MSQDFVDSVDTTTEVSEVTNYDTSRRHLEGAGLNLSRRKASDAVGWYLSIPGEELVTFESRATTPPREVSALLLAIRGGQRLMVTEKVLRESEAHLLLDVDGEVVAAVQDDKLVRSHPHGEFETDQWREIEVRHGPSSTKSSRKTMHRMLAASDAKEVAHSRLGKADAGSRPQQPARKGLGGLVDSYLQHQLRTIAFGDMDLRRQGDAVHATRVAIRRLRSTLHVFADLFDETRAKELSDELARFAGLLGHARDADIAGRRVEKLIDSAPDALDVSSARKHFVSSTASSKKAAQESIAAGMSGRRYRSLVALLEEWRVDPPYLDRASQPRKAAGRYVDKTTEKLHKRLRAATKKTGDRGDLHRARKVAKRLRYAAELAGPAMRDAGKAEQKEGRRWQQALGEVQDSRITSDLLARLGSDAPTKRDAFVFGVLWHAEESASASAYAALLPKVR